MNDLLNSASRFALSVAANSVLGALAGAVALGAVGLTALYLVEHVEETPGIKKLWCLLDSERVDCPHYENALKRAKEDLAAIEAERDRIATQLTGLRAIEAAVDKITLFESFDDPNSGLTVTVGTVYRELTAAMPAPLSYYCYVRLGNGAAGESRNLHFMDANGPVRDSAGLLEAAGLSRATWNFAISVCNPLRIGKA